MKNYKILYMGTTDFSAYILKQLIEANYNVLALISQPDRKIGRKKEIKYTATKEVALKHNINVLAFDNINDHFEQIKQLEPDLIITCAFGQKVSSEILDIPKFKSINVHASLLPKYRGGAPIQFAIMNNEKYTGNTIMYMVDKLDAGDMIANSQVEIDIEDTMSTLANKLMIDGANLLLDTLPTIFNNLVKPIKQDDNLVSYAPIITRDMEYIDCNRNVIDVYNHIRALIDKPVGYIYINNKKVKIYNVYFNNNKSIVNNITTYNDYFEIGCLDGNIVVYKFQFENKKVTDFKSYKNGNKLDIYDNVKVNEGV